MTMSQRKFDVITGAKSGVIKGIKIGRTNKENRIGNLQNLALITESDRVTRIAWGDDDEQQLLVACSAIKDNRVKIFDSESTALVNWFPCNRGIGDINGISRYGRFILTSVNSGEICIWSNKGKGKVILNAGNHLNRMCHSREQQNLVATGGMENRVKVFDLETQEIIFSAKNLSHDWLNLRLNISIADLNFLPESQHIVSVSRLGNICVYDPFTQRRPVINMTIKDEAWTCLAIPPKEKHIIVGSNKGNLNLVDLRNTGALLNTYKGFVGGVTGVACSKTNPYVASVSLDRYLRIHDINTKEVLKSIYLTSRLSSLVMRSDVSIEIGYDDGTEI